jgi:uncharacterized protein involved in exopolysaccharide biosynthesis
MPAKDINYWIDLVLRRRLTIMLVGGCLFGLVVLGTVVWPPTYESTAKILVQENRAQLLISSNLGQENAQQPAVIANPVTEQDLNSERELLTSFYLVRKSVQGLPVPEPYSGPGAAVLDAVHLALSLPAKGYRTMHDEPAVGPSDQWALKLADRLNSDVIKRSDIIEVSFRSHDPHWSQQFLNLLLSHYLSYHAQFSHDPQAEHFFNQQAHLLQERLAASEHELHAFELQTGISNLGSQQQSLISQLSDLRMQRSKAAADLASATEQVAEYSQLLHTTPERIPKEVRSVQDLALQQLKPQVMQLRAERAELLSRYQPGSKRIREIDAKLEAAQKILDKEDHLVVTERSTDLNPVWVTIDSSLAQSQGTAASVKATIGKLQDEISATQDRINFLVRNSSQYDRLQRRVATDKQALMTYLRKSEEARTAGALNSDKILNVSVAQPPLEPLKPVFPVVWLNLLLGSVFALALGIGAAQWEEERDPKIRTAHAVGRESGLRTVAVILEEP